VGSRMKATAANWSPIEPEPMKSIREEQSSAI
jgi:hypothetical protein